MISRSLSARRAHAQAGFNLIEAAIVLGIVGLVVGGIWAAASSAYENMRQQKGQSQLLSFAQSLRNYYANGSSGTVDVNTTNLISLGLVPADMIQGTSIGNPWNGAPNGTIITSAAGSFTLTYKGLPQKACANFAQRVAANSGWTSTSGSSPIGLSNIAGPGGAFSPSAPLTTCSSATSNDLAFTFSIGG